MATVAELKAMLETLDPEAEIYFTYPSGDYWRTTLALPISRIEEGAVVHSTYHGKMATLESDDGDDDCSPQPVFLIR